MGHRRTRPSRRISSLRLSECIAACALIGASAVASLGASTSATVFLPNRSFGLGEQQVYRVDRSETVTVSFRGSDGAVVTRTVKRNDGSSTALTVEGYGDNGVTVLAVAISARRTQVHPTGASDASSPPPSPSVAADGTLTMEAGAGDLSAAALVVSGAPPQDLADGSKWSTQGDLDLPSGAVTLRLAHVAAAWNGDPTVLQVISTGTMDTSGRLAVPGFGRVALHGAGAATGVSFIDLPERLVLGSTFTVTGRGNALDGHGMPGSYTLTASYTFRLARYIAGIAPAPNVAPPGLFHPGAPDTSVIGPGSPNPIAQPGPTDNVFSGSPVPFDTPTPVPEVSLPPVPLPAASGAALASPPAPPPTPMPLLTPRH